MSQSSGKRRSYLRRLPLANRGVERKLGVSVLYFFRFHGDLQLLFSANTLILSLAESPYDIPMRAMCRDWSLMRLLLLMKSYAEI